MNIDLISKKRRHPVTHPWSRGFLNNRFVAEAMGCGYDDKTADARLAGYTEKRRVLVSNGKVISHGNITWDEFVKRLRDAA